VRARLPSRPLRRPASAWFGALLLVVSFALGCSSGQTGDTSVGKKQLYRVDNPKYDELFEEVFELQKESAGARDEERAAREPLGRALDAGGASGEPLAAQATERAKKLALGKPKIVLGVEGLEPSGAPILGKAIAITPPPPKRKPWPKDAQALAAAFEETLRAEAKVIDKFAPLAGKARRRLALLEGLRGSIAQEMPSAKPEVRAQLARELDAARPALTTAATECEAASGDASKFLHLAVDGIAAAAAAKPEPKKAGPKGH
jgi:hypothetical protein